MKNEILFYTNERSRLENCLELHKLIEGGNYYVLFINMQKENVINILFFCFFYLKFIYLFIQIDEIKKEISGQNNNNKEINCLSYSNYVNKDKLIEEFKINKDELNNYSNISGAIYNRLALKDLK